MVPNSKKKRFKRFNAADVVILFVVLAIIAGVIYKFDSERSNSMLRSQDTIRISFYIESIKDAQVFRTGDTVKDRDTNAVFGEISRVVLGESVDYGVNSDGRCIVSPKPLYNSVTIVVEGKGNYSDTGVFYNNTVYYLNNNLPGFTAGQMPALTARIIGIEKL